MRRATPLAIAAIVAMLLAGCGSSGDDSTSSGSTAGSPPATTTPSGPAGSSVRSCDTYAVDAEELQATNVSCGEARHLMLAWQRAESCGLIGSASRGSCAVDPYRCLSTRTDRGVDVSCAAPGRSISFLVERD